MLNLSYFDPWKVTNVTCRCGWSGPLGDAPDDIESVCLAVFCPKCSARLAAVLFPTTEDIERAAASGNEEARRMLKDVKKTSGKYAKTRKAAAKGRRAFRESPPLLDGSGLAFVIDLDQSRGAGNLEYVVRHGDREFWREQAIWEDLDAFNNAKALLKEVYAARFATLSATDAAESVLFGDRISAGPLDPY